MTGHLNIHRVSSSPRLSFIQGGGRSCTAMSPKSPSHNLDPDGIEQPIVSSMPLLTMNYVWGGTKHLAMCMTVFVLRLRHL
mgnify:CR=1 FL=1